MLRQAQKLQALGPQTPRQPSARSPRRWVLVGLFAALLALTSVMLSSCGRGQNKPPEGFGPRLAADSHPASSDLSPEFALEASAALRDCQEVSVHCGEAPSTVVDQGDILWMAFAQHGHVWVTHSSDLGRSYARPVRVTRVHEAIETNGENRPKIKKHGSVVYVSWTRKLERRFTGEIRFARSLDSGASFQTPITVNDDGMQIGHRFDSLHVDQNGNVFLAWIDKRDLETAKQRGDEYRGAAIYYAVSLDQGATFEANRKVADHACECCRIAIAEGPGGGATVVWRHVFEGQIRDHAMAHLEPNASTPLARATVDDWHIEGCPHHGPSLVVNQEGGYDLAWFSAAQDRPAVLVGSMDAAAMHPAKPFQLANGVAQAHPTIARRGGQLWVAWKKRKGATTTVVVRKSQDGARWSEEASTLSTDGPSDHPFLLTSTKGFLLLWHTPQEGLQILLL